MRVPVGEFHRDARPEAGAGLQPFPQLAVEIGRGVSGGEFGADRVQDLAVCVVARKRESGIDHRDRPEHGRVAGVANRRKQQQRAHRADDGPIGCRSHTRAGVARSAAADPVIGAR